MYMNEERANPKEDPRAKRKLTVESVEIIFCCNYKFFVFMFFKNIRSASTNKRFCSRLFSTPSFLFPKSCPTSIPKIIMGSVNTKSALEQAELDLVKWGIAWHESTPLVRATRAKRLKDPVHVNIKDVSLDESSHIHTQEYYRNSTDMSNTPLVLIHGYAQSASQFYATAPALASEYNGPVVAIDQIGCGLSTRNKWLGGFGPDSNVKEAESIFVEALEKWRVSMKYEKVILCAHSMGAYTSVRYSERYPHRVDKLILLSPAGVPEPKEDPRYSPANLPWYFRLARKLWNKGYGPFDLARTPVVGRTVSDKYTYKRYPDRSWIPKPLLAEQLYYNWIHDNISIGGYCHSVILQPGAYAREPLCHVLPDVIDRIGHVSFIYGEKDWMTISAAEAVVQAHKDRQLLPSGDPRKALPKRAEIYRLGAAGHSFLVDNPLALADAILLAMDEHKSVSEDVVDLGAEYVAADQSLGLRAHHLGFNQHVKWSEHDAGAVPGAA
jgi:pimeloyl-ACP methyl ester carboxylesterase